MNIVHARTTSNRRIRTLPVTGNFLVRETSGMYRWNTPNDRWRLFSPVGGSKSLVTNIRLDDTEHSPDLWLYSNLTQKEISGLVSDPDSRGDMLKANELVLDRTRRWYVRQFIRNPERVGIKRFTGLPLNAFFEMWRRPLDVSKMDMVGLSNGQVKMQYKDFTFNVYLDWPELKEDLRESTSSITVKSTKVKLSEKVVPWIKKYVEGDFIPFSDYETMFVDPEEEFSYLADVA